MLAQPTAKEEATMYDQQQLAAFVELEQIDQEWAVSQYPELWTQIWRNADLLDDYLLARAFIASAADLPPLQLPAKLVPKLAFPAFQFVLTARARQLGLPKAYGAAVSRGATEKHTLFADQWHNTWHIVISVQEQGPETCALHVSVAPPCNGIVHISAAEAHFRASLQPDGSARIEQLPLWLLTDSEAPDMMIRIVPQESDEHE
jgi:hypothetical protein